MATQKTDGVPQLNQSTVEIIRVDAELIIVSLEKAVEGVSNLRDYEYRIHWGFENIFKYASENYRKHYSSSLNCRYRYWNPQKIVTHL